MKDEALKLALEALESVLANHNGAPVLPWIEARDAIKQALAAPVYVKTFHGGKPWPLHPEPVQEPLAWKWHQAPVKTSWGHDMVVADLAIDKDNTVSVYCERDQITKVEAMFTPPAAQRQWTGLTDDEIDDLYQGAGKNDLKRAREIEAKLKEKNT